jgi:sugar diacid utilization regulator
VGRVRLRVGEGVTGWAAADRRPVVVPDVRAEPRFRWLAGVDQARYVSMCSVPILSGERLVGVLNVQTDQLRDFRPEEVSFLAAIAAQVAGVLERSALQRRLEERVAELRRSEEIHRRFTALALAGAGLDAICAGIERHAGGGVAVYDEEGERLAVGDETGMPQRLEGFADPARREDDLTVLPVRAGREVLGWLAAAPADEDAAPARRRALDHGATVLALELVRERAAAETERRLRGNLLDELLDARLSPEDAGRLARRAAQLGLRLRGPVWVLVLEPDDAEAAAVVCAPPGSRRLARRLSALLDAHRPGGLVVERGGGMVLLAPGELTLAQVESLAAAALTAAAPVTGGASLSCGVGSGPGGPPVLRRLAAEAHHALRVARRLGRRGEVATFARLGVERLLLEVSSPDRLDAYVEEWLGPLLRHDRTGRAAAPLVQTLDALVAESWSLRGAARRLTVHVNTLLYRVRRIEEVSGRSLDDTETRLALAMALRARALTGGLDVSSKEEGGESRAADPYPAPGAATYGEGNGRARTDRPAAPASTVGPAARRPPAASPS